MRIIIKELELGPVKMTGEVAPESLGLDPAEVMLPDPVTVTVEAEKHTLGIWVRGQFKTEGQVPCARCLEAVLVPVVSEFDLFYQQNDSQHPLTGEIELKENDTDVSFFTGDGIEVCDIVREQLLLNLPMKPVCREDCKGLCPHCGKNRNVEACDCEKVLLDPRLEPLLKIKNRMNF
jgi:uncharacterized protein